MVQVILKFFKIRLYNYGFLINMLYCNPNDILKYSRSLVDVGKLPNHVNLCLDFLLLSLFSISYYSSLLFCTVTTWEVILCGSVGYLLWQDECQGGDYVGPRLLHEMDGSDQVHCIRLWFGCSPALRQDEFQA
jgi:hypothetical protein